MSEYDELCRERRNIESQMYSAQNNVALLQEQIERLYTVKQKLEKEKDNCRTAQAG